MGVTRPPSEVSLARSSGGLVRQGSEARSKVTKKKGRSWGVRVVATVLALQQLVTEAAVTYLVCPVTSTNIGQHLDLTSVDLYLFSLLGYMGPIITSLLMGAICGRGHKARWVGVGQALAGVGALLTTLTALTPPPTPAQGSDPRYCDVNKLMSLATADPGIASLATADPDKENPCQTPSPLIFTTWIVASVISGVGTSMGYIMGLPYLDDGVKRVDAPLYLAVVVGSGAFGKVIGEWVATSTQSSYVHPNHSTGVAHGSQGWVGAWWAGQVIWAVSYLALTCLSLSLPRHLMGKKNPPIIKTIPPPGLSPNGGGSEGGRCSPPPPYPPYPLRSEEEEEEEEENDLEDRDIEGGYEADVERDSGYSMEGSDMERMEEVLGWREEARRKRRREEEEEEEEEESQVVRKIIKKRYFTFDHVVLALKESWAGVRRLASNRILGVTLGVDLLLGVGVGAMAVWGPSHLSHLSRPAKEASNIYTGITSTSSVIIGVGVGGVWVARCRPRARTLALLMALFLGLLTAAAATLTYLNCDFETDLPGILSPDGRTLELHRACSEGCRCDSRLALRPVCVQDGPLKLSYFSPCHAGCPPPPHHNAPLANCTCGSKAAQVFEGFCRHTCPAHLAHRTLTCLATSLLPVATLINLLIALRSVRNEDKPAALGLKYSLWCLGHVGGPLMVGGFLWPRCLVWGARGCGGGGGGGGGCQLYDTMSFAYALHGTTSAVFLLGTILALILARATQNLTLFHTPTPLTPPLTPPLPNTTPNTTNNSPNSFQRVDHSGMRRSLRKLSRLAAGKTSTGTWNVPRFDSRSGLDNGGFREGGEEGEGDHGVQVRRLPCVTLLKTTGV